MSKRARTNGQVVENGIVWKGPEALRPMLVPVAELSPDPANMNLHDDESIRQIMASFRRFGQQKTISHKAGVTGAGSGSLEAVRRLGWTHIAAIETDLERVDYSAFGVADNRSAQFARWSEDLPEFLRVIEEQGGPSAEELGFKQEDLDELVRGAKAAEAEGEGRESIKSDGSLLSLVDVTIGEPRHVCEAGQVYLLGGKHKLIIADVIRGHKHWIKLLEDDDLLLPYPGPFVALSVAADKHTLVLIQPDVFTAGHILDQYENIHGQNSVILCGDTHQ